MPMTTRATLQFQGSLGQGFHITLSIRDRQGAELTEAQGQLPPAPELLTLLNQWQESYRKGVGSSRLTLESISVEMGSLAQLAACRDLGKKLQQQLCRWLESRSFQAIDKRLRETLHPQDVAELMVRSDDRRLHRLPWHLWDFIERYGKTEVIFGSAPERITRPSSTSAQVRVLLILGDRRNIDTEVDRQLLEQLPQAAVTTLVEPSRPSLDQHLWEQPWDILFFAGHSHSDGHQGYLGINAQESLTIEELRYGLRRAIHNGLQLALFNSCDGLGLAYELEPLHIPQLIAMREPVPDAVAQAFVQSFLKAFSEGKQLHLALREARERLLGLETDFPWATWLPVLFQNPAAETPTWKSLQAPTQPATVSAQPALASALELPGSAVAGQGAAIAQAVPDPATPNPTVQNPAVQNPTAPSPAHGTHPGPAPSRMDWPRRLGTALALGLALLGLRQGGWLQRPELALFDQLVRSRGSEPEDDRILVIEVTEENIRTAQDPHQRSLSDPQLLQLLTLLEGFEPAAIGLDLYRPEATNLAALQGQFSNSRRLVGVCKGEDADQAIAQGIAPPPAMDPQQVGFSDVPKSIDGIARIQLLSAEPPASSPCQTDFALSTILADQYFASHNLALSYPDRHTWQWGDQRLRRLGVGLFGQSSSYAHYGPFARLQVQGHQILLNYRAHQSPGSLIQDPSRAFQRISFNQALAGQLSEAAVRGKIVLIGVTGAGSSDRWLTPFHTAEGNPLEIPGVYLQAQLTSQLLSAVLDGRPLLRCLPWLVEGAILLGLVLAGTLLLGDRRPAVVVVTLVVMGGSIYLLSLAVLTLTGIYLPLFPALLALAGSGGASLVRRAVFPPRNDSRPTTDIRYFIHESISGSR